MHYCTPKKDVSLAKEFQKHLSKDDCTHEVIDQEGNRKRSSKRKCTDREYHAQYNSAVSHKYVTMYCDTNQFPKLPFCGSHPKPHEERGLGKHYHLRFDPNLGIGICAICCIPCACATCISILYQPWISGIQLKKQARYQPVINCTY